VRPVPAPVAVGLSAAAVVTGLAVTGVLYAADRLLRRFLAP
jgi:hypothetical protein